MRALLHVSSVLSIWVLALSAGAAQAQTFTGPPAPTLRSWTVADGLPYDIVWAVEQTPDGYLWVGTRGGLVRFDGTRFTHFDTQTTPELASSDVRTLHVDPEGVLWIGTSGGGLTRYADGAFETLRTADGLPDETVWALATDPADGALWIGTLGGLARLSGGAIETFGRSDGLLTDDVRALDIGPDGTLWVGTYGGGLHRREAGGFAAISLAGAEAGPWVHALLAMPTATLIGVGKGQMHASDRQLLEWDGERLAPVSGLPRLHSPRALVRTSDGAVWIGTYGSGVAEWAPGGVRRLGRTDGLADDRVTSLHEDRDGNLWIGTMGGLTRLRRDTPLATYGRPEGLPGDNVRAIAQAPDGAVWITTDRGVARVDASGVRALTGADGLPEPFVESVLADTLGVWLGAQSTLTRLHEGRTTVHHPPGVAFQSLARTPDGALWIGSFGGGLIRMRGGAFEVFTQRDGLAHDNVSVLLAGRDGRLWIGTEGGLSVLERGRLRTITPLPGLPGVHVRSLHEDADGTLWVGTVGRGVVRLRGSQADAFSTETGLYDDGIWSIVDDRRGHLWMSADRGVFRVARSDFDAVASGARERLTPVAYGVSDGMRTAEANGAGKPSGIRSADGRVWFATQRGVVVADPGALRPRVPTPLVEHAATRSGPLRADGRARLPLGERDIELVFTAPELSHAEHVRFRYRLDGYDTEWTAPTSRRSATYTNLDPGPYTFAVQAAVGSGPWGEPAALSLHVPPAPYETTWFAALVLLVLGGLATAAYRARIGQLRRREIALEARVEARTRELREAQRTTQQQAARLIEQDRLKSRFFTNVSHEFRTPLTLAIGPLEDLERMEALPPEGRPYVDLALRNTRRLLRLTNQLLDVARLEAGELRLSAARHDLCAFARDLAQPFVPLAERRRVRFDVRTPAHPLLVTFDSDKLEQVLANLLSNAFKFTPEGGAVRLTLATDDRAAPPRVRLTVRDSGPGIAPEHLPHLFDRFYQADAASTVQTGSGVGLSLARDLARLHGGTLTVDSDPGFGATFALTLPFSEGDGPARGDSVSAAPSVQAALLPLDELDEAHAGDGADASDPRTTVLVADDNADIRSYVRGHLEAAGYRVVEAADGAQALERVRADLPDLIVSDVMMPKLDGLGLVRAIRSDPETDFLPVLLLTARATSEATVAGLDAGADDYLTKPFAVAELAARVSSLITRRRRLAERFRVGAGLRVAVIDGADVSDDPFVDRLREVVHEHLSDEAFGIEALADALGQNRSTVYRRLREATGQTPSAFLRLARVERAAELLQQGQGTVGEVAYAVGFKSVSHFSQAFKSVHGVSPSAFARGARAS
jgi:signal transduction histidine kinase/DNA-binding response OmpR family regulator/sugar lactone lactonase YvrE